MEEYKNIVNREIIKEVNNIINEDTTIDNIKNIEEEEKKKKEEEEKKKKEEEEKKKKKG